MMPRSKVRTKVERASVTRLLDSEIWLPALVELTSLTLSRDFWGWKPCSQSGPLPSQLGMDGAKPSASVFESRQQWARAMVFEERWESLNTETSSFLQQSHESKLAIVVVDSLMDGHSKLKKIIAIRGACTKASYNTGRFVAPGSAKGRRGTKFREGEGRMNLNKQ
mmetsp:Transcript_89465/g.186924  ORF Transcript_89465/g.186924 Transcript_89465/m.186924 type:complete len:166 (-) Transcript_89465:146-643(-)